MGGAYGSGAGDGWALLPKKISLCYLGAKCGLTLSFSFSPYSAHIKYLLCATFGSGNTDNPDAGGAD